MIDFGDTNVVAVTVTADGRQEELYGTAAALLSNVTNFRWIIVCSYMKDQVSGLLEELAKATGNTVEIRSVPTGRSVASSKALAIQDLHDSELIFNVDDDHLFPYRSLAQIKKVVATGRVGGDLGVVTSSAVDVSNIHGYEDWSNEMRSPTQLPKFIQKFGLRSAAHQKWDIAETVLLRTDYISNGWLVPRSLFELPAGTSGLTILEKMLTWPVGVRGYDCMMQTYLLAHGIPIHLILGAYINHVGMSPKGWYEDVASHSHYYQEQVAGRVAPANFHLSDLISI